MTGMPATSNFEVSVSVGDVTAGESSTAFASAALFGAFAGAAGRFPAACPDNALAAITTIAAARATPYPIPRTPSCFFMAAPPDATRASAVPSR